MIFHFSLRVREADSWSADALGFTRAFTATRISHLSLSLRVLISFYFIWFKRVAEVCHYGCVLPNLHTYDLTQFVFCRSGGAWRGLGATESLTMYVAGQEAVQRLSCLICIWPHSKLSWIVIFSGQVFWYISAANPEALKHIFFFWFCYMGHFAKLTVEWSKYIERLSQRRCEMVIFHNSD